MTLGQPFILSQVMLSDFTNPAYMLPCFFFFQNFANCVKMLLLLFPSSSSSCDHFLLLTSPSCPLRHSLANLQFLLHKRPHETLICQVLRLIIDFLSTRSEEHQAWSDLFCLKMLWEGSRTLKTPVSPKR